MQLYKHQQAGIEFIMQRGGSGALFHSMGAGKTLSGLSLYKILKEKEPSLQLFIICPLSLLEHTWIDHINRFFPEFTYCNLRGMKDHWPVVDVYLLNYESLIRKEMLMKVNTLVSHGTWMCVIDESARLKSHTTLITKACLFLRDRFAYRLCLSGLPAPNNELEYFGQMAFIDRNALSPSFTQFRNTYFYLADRIGRELQPTYSREGMAALFVKHGAHYVANKHKQKALMDRIGQYSHFVTKAEALPDLPELVEEVRTVELSAPEMAIYKDMKRHLIVEIQSQEITARNALVKIMKLRQITSGFLINEDQEAVQLPIEGGSTKLKELKNVLGEIGAEQAIIWCNFKSEIHTVCEMLGKAGKTYDTLYSGTDDRDQAIQDFKDGKSQFLVANPQSGGHGLNLQHCHIEIYFSVNYSYELMEQSQARIHRPGQTHKCVAIYLLAKDTIDEDIYEVVTKKKDLNELLRGYLK